MDAVASAWAMIDAIIESRYSGVIAPSLQHKRRAEQEKARQKIEQLKKLPPMAVRYSNTWRLTVPSSALATQTVPKAALDQQAAQRQRQSAADTLSEELLRLSHQELARAYRDAIAAKMIEDEKKLTFNQPWSAADYSHFGKMPLWTVDEFTALALGKNPERVNWASVQPHVAISPFAKRYSELRDLLTRAVTAGQVYEKSSPWVFISWARHNDVELDDRLVTRAVNDGLSLKHWYDVAQEQKQRADSAAAQNRDLQHRIDELESRSPQQPAPTISSQATTPDNKRPDATTPSAQTRKYNKAVTLLFGLTKHHYRIDFAGGKIPNVQKVITDLLTVGVKVDDKTLRDHLRAGSEAAAKDS